LDFFLCTTALLDAGIAGMPDIPAGIPGGIDPLRICFIAFCAAENLSTS